MWIYHTVQIAGKANTNCTHISRTKDHKYRPITYIDKAKAKGSEKTLLCCIPSFRENG